MEHSSSRRDVAFGLVLGLAGVLTAPAAESEETVTPADVAAPTDAASRVELTKPPPKSGMARWGGFEFFPRASGSVLYDDNINIQPVAPQSDLIWSLSPGVTVMAGNPGVELPPAVTFDSMRMMPRQPYIGLDAEPAKMFLFDYAPTAKVFTRYNQYNSVDHTARLTGIYSLSRLTLGLDQDYTKSSGTIADVGSRVTSQFLTTRLTSKYDLSDRTCIEINGQYQNTSYADARFTGSRQWENQNWIDRQVSAKVNAGLGLTFGYWDVDRSPSQTYEQVLVRAIYRFAEKMDFTTSVGGEARQFSGGASASFTPVFSLGGSYRPVDATTVTLEGHRVQQSSASSGSQNYTLTGFSAGVRQRFLEKWFASLNASYDLAAYHATGSGISASRTDNFFSVRLGMDYQFTERWTSGAYYTFRRDSSNEGFGFNNNQIGVQGSWHF